VLGEVPGEVSGIIGTRGFLTPGPVHEAEFDRIIIVMGIKLIFSQKVPVWGTSLWYIGKNLISNFKEGENEENCIKDEERE